MDPGDTKQSDGGQWSKSDEIPEREQHDRGGYKSSGQEVLLPAGQVSRELDRCFYGGSQPGLTTSRTGIPPCSIS
jgi:hypothetical protein